MIYTYKDIEFDFTHYIDKDGFISPRYVADPDNECGSQNGYFYTGLTNALLENDYDLIDRVLYNYDKFGYKRNSITSDVVSFDDLYVINAYLNDELMVDLVRKKFWHPAKSSWHPRWWLGRNPSFVTTVLWVTKESFFRNLGISTAGCFEDGSTPFLQAFMISELYSCSKYAKKQLRKNAMHHWPDGMIGAFREHFGEEHPLTKISLVRFTNE